MTVSTKVKDGQIEIVWFCPYCLSKHLEFSEFDDLTKHISRHRDKLRKKQYVGYRGGRN